MTYDVSKYFDFLGYGCGDQTYECPGLRSLAIYCRGDEGQLKEFLEPTPFTLRDSRFMISIADFGNNSGLKYYDAAVVLAVDYEGLPGGTYYFEWEDNHRSVALGRELWGYPKHYAKIALEEVPGGLGGRVWLEDEEILNCRIVFDDSMTPDRWAGLSFYPHIQVRAIGESNGPNFSSFEVLRRDTSKDFRIGSVRRGSASVKVGADVARDGNRLKILEVVGAEYTIGDFAATRENGTPRIVAKLV